MGPNSPRKGDEQVLPDPLVEILASKGEVENIRPWPEVPAHPEPEKHHYLPRIKRPERTR
jgi:hypothetical protein